MSRVKEDIIWMLPSPTCRRRKCFSGVHVRNRPPHEFREDGTVAGRGDDGNYSKVVFRRIWMECGTQVHSGCPEKWRWEDARRREAAESRRLRRRYGQAN